MERLLTFIIYISAFSNITFAQNNSVDKVIVEPTYSGGYASMMSFIQKNLKYPNADLSANIEGKVEVTFNVEPDGTISNVHITKGLTETTNAEAIRVVKAMSKWIPGTIDGIKTSQEVILPFNFSLQ